MNFSMVTNSDNDTKQDLSQRTVSGSAWVFITKVAQQGISLLQLAILGRLLDPKDFGLMGIASLATQAIAVFIYTGYEFALVQKVDLSEEDIHTAFWVMVGRRTIIGFMLMALSWPIASLYHVPEAVPILLAMAFTQIILGFATPVLSLWQRELQFRKAFDYYLWSSIIGFLSGVMAAYILRNVWALVIATFFGTLAQVIFSYLLHPYRPRLLINRDSFRGLTSYGKWMLGSSILWFAYSQGATAFSGWMFGVTALGLYQMAGRFALLPSTLFGETILGSVFPAYSLIQQDTTRVRGAFLRVLQLSAMIIFSITALIALTLPRVFILVLGEKWTEATPLIPVIAMAGGVMAMLRTGSPLYLGTGLPRFQFNLDLVQTTVMLLLLYPLGRWLGLAGLPFATLVGAVFALPIWWFGVKKTANCTFVEVARALLPALCGTGIMVVILWGGQSLDFTGHNYIGSLAWLCFLVMLSVVFFGVTVWGVQLVSSPYITISEMWAILKRFIAPLSPLLVRFSR